MKKEKKDIVLKYDLLTVSEILQNDSTNLYIYTKLRSSMNIAVGMSEKFDYTKIIIYFFFRIYG